MKKTKKIIAGLVRIAIAFGIIFCIFHRMDMPALSAVLKESLHHWTWMAAGILLCFGCLCCGVARWKIILNAQGLRMSWSRVFRVYFIGHFFNAFMFGATGGDLVRAYYAARETHHKKTETVTTVLIDRVSGAMMVNLVAAMILIARSGFFIQHRATHIPALIMAVIIAGSIVMLVLILNIKRFKHWIIFRRAAQNQALSSTIQRILAAIDVFRSQTRIMAGTFLLSLAAQVFVILECACLGRSFQMDLRLLDYLTVIPIILSIAAIPITPGGLGIREGLAVTMFNALNVASAQSVPLSLMIYACSVIWSLVGGVIFLGYSVGSGHTLHEEMEHLRHEAVGEEGELGIAGPHE